jgi:hypothetical protein
MGTSVFVHTTTEGSRRAIRDPGGGANMDRLADLEVRLAQAERRGRMLAASQFIAVAALLVSGGLAAPAKPTKSTAGTTLRAPVRIIDQNGKTCAEVTSLPGGGRLTIRSHKGKEVVSLGTDALDPKGIMLMSNENGDPDIMLVTDTDGGVVGVGGKNGFRQAALSGIGGEGGTLELFNARHEVREPVVRVVARNPGGAINVSDGAGSVRGVLAANELGDGLLLLLDRRLNETAVLGGPHEDHR